MPWEFDADQFGVTNPTPTTASQAAIAAANERVALAHDWAVLQEALTPGTVNMDPIDAECYTEGLGAMACMWDWGRAPSTLGATDFAIAMLAPLLIAQLPAIAGWAAGQAATVSQAAAAACANRCPAVTRWIANAGEEAVECGMSLSDGAQWIDSIDCTLALIGTRASVETGGGAPPPGERAVGYSNDGYVYRGVATNTADDLVPRRPGPGTPHVDDLPGAQSLFDLPKNATILDDFNEIARRLDVNHGIPRVTASERLHEIKAASGLGGADNVLFGPTGDVWDPVTGDWLGSLTAGGAP